MIEIHITLPLFYTDEDIKKAIFSVLPTLGESELISYTLRGVSVNTGEKPPQNVNARAILDVTKERERGLLKMKKTVKEFVEPILTIPTVKRKPPRRPVVVGFGPAGLFCSLILAEAGCEPLVLECGKAVDERARDVETFFEGGPLDPWSNIQFGEGGAGAFSDGKLKYGTLDPYVYKVLTEFVGAGAPEDILSLKAPHIGTDNLPRVVRNLREKLKSLGAEVRFCTRLIEVIFDGGAVSGLRVLSPSGEEIIRTDTLFLATGHSARDLFYMLEEKGVSMQARPFGMGVRIEHKQKQINEQIYGDNTPFEDLPSASYHLVTHLENGRSVYSFCMCPGGEVVAATSNANAVVTNGMSPYRRDGENANAALLVSLFPEDFEGDSPMRGIRFQEEIERRAFLIGGGNYRAVGMRLDDFLSKSAPREFGDIRPTYARGVTLCALDDLFPSFITDSLREAILDFDAYQEGFSESDAVLTAPETRSTSPVRILRDKESYLSVSHRGLYPCGEGAGYSGGILSSATDGIRSAIAYLKTLQ